MKARSFPKSQSATRFTDAEREFWDSPCGVGWSAPRAWSQAGRTPSLGTLRRQQPLGGIRGPRFTPPPAAPPLPRVPVTRSHCECSSRRSRKGPGLLKENPPQPTPLFSAPTPRALVTTPYCSARVTPCVSEMGQDLPFSVWLISLSITSTSFINVATNRKNPFVF